MEGLFLCVFKNENACSGYVIDVKFIDGLSATAVFGTLPRLGEISVRRFEHRILVSMPELALHRSIPGLCTLVLLNGTLLAVLVLFDQTSHKVVLPVMKQSYKKDERNLTRLQQQAYPKDFVEGRIYSVLRRAQLRFEEITMRHLVLSVITATVLLTGLWAQGTQDSRSTAAGTVQTAGKKSGEKTGKHHHHKHHHKKHS
jgi:hypothetical protein